MILNTFPLPAFPCHMSGFHYANSTPSIILGIDWIILRGPEVKGQGLLPFISVSSPTPHPPPRPPPLPGCDDHFPMSLSKSSRSDLERKLFHQDIWVGWHCVCTLASGARRSGFAQREGEREGERERERERERQILRRWAY